MSIHPEVNGFSKAADAYERGRPGYLPEVVDWIVEIGAIAPGKVIVDLAAGTGKLTRALVSSGAEIIAVEPLEEMRSALAVSVRGVRSVAGTAEAMALPSGSADVVTVGQAFHWFARESALAEIARVLRGDGVLVLVWNRRDSSQAIQAEVSRIIEPYRSDTPSHGSGGWRLVMEASARFAPLGEFHVATEQVVDRPGLVDRVASISFIANLPDAARSSALAEIASLITDERATVSLRYVTDAFAYRLAH